MPIGYDRRTLAVYAAGLIDSAGQSPVGFGCGMTRLGIGLYAMVLPEDAGLEDRISILQASPRQEVGASGAAAAMLSHEDTSLLVRTIFARSVTRIGGGATAIFADIGLEVTLYRPL